MGINMTYGIISPSRQINTIRPPPKELLKLRPGRQRREHHLWAQQPHLQQLKHQRLG